MSNAIIKSAAIGLWRKNTQRSKTQVKRKKLIKSAYNLLNINE
ncbi:hypothetical protein cje79_02675 [Campylobacter jejuni subsp. jejuni 1893]|nr:hypothetical protein cje79_02675 [Campylobacter jejuni subsp. jejuni 1893]